MAWWTAFLLGLVGSLHCLGMCGPLALALPAARRQGADFVAGRILYNGGRILTYGVLGVLFGLIGQSLVLAGLQQWLSILAGLFILGYLLLRRRPAFAVTGAGWVARAVGRLKTSLGGLLKHRSKRALFGIGLLNGLLPCGLVYVALAAAAATGSAGGGLEYMVWFGIGTTPLMLGVSMAGKAVQGSLHRHFQRLVPVALAAMAVLFLLRGMSLGIPYVSPDLHAGPDAAACH